VQYPQIAEICCADLRSDKTLFAAGLACWVLPAPQLGGLYQELAKQSHKARELDYTQKELRACSASRAFLQFGQRQDSCRRARNLCAGMGACARPQEPG